MTSAFPERPFSVRWSWREVAGLAVLCLLVCVLVWPGMASDVFLDDKDELAHVAKFKSWADTRKGDSFGLFRPVKNLLYYYFNVNGMPSLGKWHALNLGVYLASIFAVHGLLRRIMGSAGWGLLAAVLWATSATQASTAIWMSCVNISLSMVFTCGAIALHDKSREGAKAPGSLMLGTVLLTFLAQASYETALCIGPLCVLVDLLRQRTVVSKAAILRYAALILATIGFLGLRARLGAVNYAGNTNFGFDPAMPWWQLTVSAPWMLWEHFAMWLFPFGRIEFISTYVWGVSASPVELAAAWGFLILLIAAIFVTRKRLPLVAFGLAWFLVASFPASNFIPVRAGPVEDYYLVFPGVGLAIVLTAIARALVGRMKLAKLPEAAGRAMPVGLVVTMLLVGFIWRAGGMLLFREQARLWSNPLELYLTCMQTRPAQFQNRAGAAHELMDRGEYELAEQYVDQAIQEGPWYLVSMMLKGEIAYKQGQFERARECFDRTAVSSLGRSKKLHNFAIYREAEMLMQSKAYPQAREMLLQILVDPTANYHYEATLTLSDIYIAEGHPDKAAQTLKKSLDLHPDKAAELQNAMALLSAFKSGAVHPAGAEALPFER